MNAKTLAGVQLVGGLVAGYFGWSAGRWDSVIFALVFLIMAWHHFKE